MSKKDIGSLGQLFTDSPTPILIEDLEGRIVEVNPEAERAYGWSAPELVNQPSMTLVPPEWQEQARDLLQRCLRGEPVRDVRSRRITREGGQSAVLVTLSLLRDDKGPTGVATFVRDVSARQRIEDELQVSSDQVTHLTARDHEHLVQLEAILQQMNDGLIVFAPDGALHTMNAAARGFHGVHDGVVPGTIEELHQAAEVFEVERDVPVPVEDWPASRALRGESFVSMEVRVRWRGRSTWRVGSYGGRMVRDAQGHPLFAILTERDVTEQHTARQAAREGARHFRQLADSMPQLVWTAGPDGVVDYYNERHHEFAGLEHTGDDGWIWAPVLHPDDRESTLYAWERAVQAGENYQIEHRVLRATGVYRWYLSRASPVRDAEGRIVRWYGAATDIDDFKRAEAALRESRERLRLSLEAGLLGVWSLELAEAHMIFDSTCQRLFELPETSTLEEFLERIHPEDYGLTLETIALAAAPGEHQDYRLECRLRVGEEYRWIYATGRGQFRGAAGTPADRLLGVVQDVTARKEVEAQLREADMRKDDFLAMLGHELRNPLAAIANGVRVIERRGVSAIEVVPMVERHVDQMSRLLDDLLDISRITRGKLSINTSVQPLAPILEAAVDAVRPRVEEFGHTLVVDAVADLLVRADAARLQQVLSNLLDNAVSYTPVGGHIRLWVRADEESLTMGVRDDGRGIEPDAIEGIFEPFVQGSSEQRRGLGIGLALVRRLVELHGGEVEGHSAGEGNGAEFVVTLPRPKSGLEERSDLPGRALSFCEVEGLRVLAVDDNVDAARLMAMLLEDRGCVVDVVVSGQACLEQASRRAYQVVLLDIGMPDLDGREVARRLRTMEGYEETRLIAVSGYTQARDVRASLDAGFDAHLGKPVSPDLLEEVIGRLIAAPRHGGAPSSTSGLAETSRGEVVYGLEDGAAEEEVERRGDSPSPAQAGEQAGVAPGSARELVRLLGQLDHDVRGPLGAVVSLGWLLRQGGDPEQSHDMGEDLAEASKRITGIVSRARDHGTIEALGEAALERRPAELRAIVDALQASLGRDAPELSLRGDAEEHGEWDVERLGVALGRVVLPWLERDSLPFIESRVVGRRAELALRFAGALPAAQRAGDDGAGLDAAGVDLDYLARLVELHHGQVHRELDDAGGTTLRIELPVDRADDLSELVG